MSEYCGSLALWGWHRDLLSLGLMAVRRDINLLGLCPQSAPLATGQELEHPLDVAMFSTLLLGCPILEKVAELSSSDLIVADSDINLAYLTSELTLYQNQDALVKVAIFGLLDDNLTEINAPPGWHILTLSPPMSDITTLKSDIMSDKLQACQTPYFCSLSLHTLELCAQLWDVLNSENSESCDAGLVNWKQAQALIAPLYNPHTTD